MVHVGLLRWRETKMSTSEAVEENVRSECVAQLETLLPETLKPHVRAIEGGIFAWAIDYCRGRSIACAWGNPLFEMAYHHKARSIVANSDKFLENPDVRYERMAATTRHELCPRLWGEVEENNIRRINDAYDADAVVAMTDLFICTKCKSRKCSYTERQTRSADEATTVFVRCLVCHHSWKMS